MFCSVSSFFVSRDALVVHAGTFLRLEESAVQLVRPQHLSGKTGAAGGGSCSRAGLDGSGSACRSAFACSTAAATPSCINGAPYNKGKNMHH